MAYQVIARKWRPQTYSDVVAQDHVAKTIANSINNGRISHAYLFAGPRGVGKTTMARIVAKSLNCVNGPTAQPCGVCQFCIEIKNGNSFDVIEIDGASNTGVDNIRELRENVHSAPLKSRYKVYIIDEVHMLSKSAFNALLKTLEEPPAHVVFIFATTEIHQIPETILSRCQKFIFKRIPVVQIVQQLSTIAEKEGYSVDKKALYHIARASGGSMRDAQSLLDQVISFGGKEITEGDVLSLLGIVSLAQYCDCIDILVRADTPALIHFIEDIISAGVDIARFVTGFADVVYAMRLCKVTDVSALLGYSDEELTILRQTSEKFHDEQLGLFYNMLLDCHKELRYAGNERAVVEMFCIDIMQMLKRPTLASILKQLDEVPQEVQKKKLSDSAQKESKPEDDKKVIMHAWTQLLHQLRESKQYIFFKLTHVKATYTNGQLVLGVVGDSSNGYYQQLLSKQEIKQLEDELFSISKRKVVIRIESDKNDVPPPDAVMLPHAEDPEKPHPLVEQIKTIFDGEIIK
ncbi:MAG: DNA polymerase III subunit gamma/tau [Spirochaetes bacterium]|nr:DNA polymerase III subunit gamma/tau [Spirochaetota bacterium]